jgi:hypothetical protein
MGENGRSSRRSTRTPIRDECKRLFFHLADIFRDHGHLTGPRGHQYTVFTFEPRLGSFRAQLFCISLAAYSWVCGGHQSREISRQAIIVFHKPPLCTLTQRIRPPWTAYSVTIPADLFFLANLCCISSVEVDDGSCSLTSQSPISCI